MGQNWQYKGRFDVIIFDQPYWNDHGFVCLGGLVKFFSAWGTKFLGCRLVGGIGTQAEIITWHISKWNIANTWYIFLPSSSSFLQKTLGLLFLASPFSFICQYLHSWLNRILMRTIIVKVERVHMITQKCIKNAHSIVPVFTFILKEEVLFLPVSRKCLE